MSEQEMLDMINAAAGCIERKDREISALNQRFITLQTQHAGCSDLKDINDNLEAKNEDLRRKLEIAKSALRFYESRAVYEHLSQFPGDGQFVKCDDIATDALAVIDSEERK